MDILDVGIQEDIMYLTIVLIINTLAYIAEF